MLAKAAAVLKKDSLTAVRYRNGLFFSAVAPALQLLTFYYLSRAVGSQFRPEGMSYFTFLLVGTGFYTFLLAGMYGIVHQLQEAQHTGTLEVLMTSATPPLTLLYLMTLSAFASALVPFVLYISTGLFLFSSGLHASIAGMSAVFVLSLLIAASLSMFAAGVQISLHKGSAVLWLFGSSAWLLSGTLFPIAALPGPIRLISYLLTFTHCLTAMRLAIVDAAGPALRYEIGILSLFTVIVLPASAFFFSWTLRRARELGTLSFC